MRRFSLLFLFLTTVFFAMAQDTPVSGRVVSSTGAGLQGINVLVKGTSKGTVTKADGSFSLNAPANGTLSLSGVGYAQQDVPVDGQSNITITIAESTTELTGVVVTALGITKESRKLGYAVTTVSGDNFTKARETNVALSLSGQAPGLDVHGISGGPGGSARILLRGMSSINSAGSPLFVINGVPMDNSQRGAAGEWGGADNGDGIDNINPDDIESMTVLKGQAASALYGTRASNGVIIVTTKKGRKGNATIEYNTNLSFDKAVDNTDFQYVYGQGTGGLKPTTAAGAKGTARFSWGAKLDGSSVIQADGNQYPYSAVTDNIKNFYRTGRTYTNTVSVSGGTEKGSYRLSLSNLTNNAIVENSGLFVVSDIFKSAVPFALCDHAG